MASFLPLPSFHHGTVSFLPTQAPNPNHSALLHTFIGILPAMERRFKGAYGTVADPTDSTFRHAL